MTKLLSTSALMITLAFTGVAYAHEQGKGHEGPPPFMEEMLSKLPEKDAELFRDTMKQSHEKDHALQEQGHKLRDELYDITTADTFDKKAFIAKSNQLTKLHEKMHANQVEAFASALSKLPADERQTIADAMHDHEWHHGPEKGDGDKPLHDPDDDK